MTQRHDGDSVLSRADRYLAIKDAHVRGYLDKVSLIGEIPDLDRWYELAFKALMLRLSSVGQNDAAARRYIDMYPFAAAAAMIGFAREKYAGGALWPSVEAFLSERNRALVLSEKTRKALREGIIDALRRAKLPTVGTGYELVDTAALHAGVPTYCLDDWFNLIRRAQDRRVHEPEDFVRWATASRDLAVMRDIDQPIKRLLTAGPEFAADLFERAADLAEYLRSTYSVDELTEIGSTQAAALVEAEHGAVQRAAELGLTARWVQRGARNLARHGAGPGLRRYRSRRPVLQLDRADGVLEVSVPAVEDPPGPVTWRVQAGEHSFVEIAALDLSGEVIVAEPTTIRVTSPARVLDVSNGTAVETLLLWSDEAPLLAFSSIGTPRPSKNGAIAPGLTWLLIPETLIVLRDGLEIPIAAEDDAPLGWSHWRLIQVDLRPHELLTLRRLEGDATLRVQGKTLPEVLEPDAIVGARSFGQPVLPSAPSVRIPTGGIDWHVSVTREPDSEPCWSVTISEAGIRPLLEGLPAPLGKFTVSIRGPLGRKLSHSFSIASGLKFSFVPHVRALDSTGRLLPGAVTIATGPGITPTPRGASLSTSESRVPLTLRNTVRERLKLACYPPATLVGWSDKGSIRWGPRPVRFDSTCLTSEELLYLQKPSAADPPPLVAVNPQGRPVQELQGKRAGKAFVYRLGALADTLEADGPLRLQLGTELVGTVGPRPMVRGIALNDDGSELQIEGSAGITGLEAWVWWVQAPWRAPRRLDVPADWSVSLPAELVRAGPLRVHTRVVDPWDPVDAGPGREAPRTYVESPGKPSIAPDEARVFAALQDPAVLMDAAAVQIAIQMAQVGFHDAARLPGGLASRDAILRLLRQTYPGEVLDRLLAEDLPPSQFAQSFIAFGVAQAVVKESGRSAEIWATSPGVAAIVASAALFPADGGDASQTADDYARGRATVSLGEELIGLLDGADPDQSIGRITRNTSLFGNMDPDEQQAIIEQSGWVPAAPLAPNSRILDALTLLKLQATARLQGLPGLQALTDWALERLSANGLAESAADIVCMKPHHQDNNVHWVPAAVRCYAHLARASAHDRIGALDESTLRSLESAMQLISDGIPGLVMRELARAEILQEAWVRATGVPNALTDPPARRSP